MADSSGVQGSAPSKTSCMSKMYSLPFFYSQTVYSALLEFVYIDLWGPTPINSRSGYKYYMSIIDAFTRYTCLYLLTSKLQTFLRENGIDHRLPCPYTHQQQSVVERKHRHITEMGLTLLAIAKLPQMYWEDAFLTAAFLINRLPTKVFNIKRGRDNSIKKYKVRLVAKGCHQVESINYNQIYNRIICPTTIHIILSIAISKGWCLCQFDFNNAFLNGELTETVFMLPPPGLYTDTNDMTNSSSTIYLLTYVDDIVITDDNNHEIENSGDLHISQAKYICDLLHEASMDHSNSVPSLMLPSFKLTDHGTNLFPNPTLYRSIVGGLQYATLAHPDIAYVVDANWATDLDDRRSTNGYCVYPSSNPIFWSSKKLQAVSWSSTEAEYRSLEEAVA
ncbi:uncharacterized protein LOC107607772 [Arachis ipaensis]|uniref:uncharacterized protein LOC107607772 n=1 Tax=Arachis ipaensis TaxID=130454 RepID=UPI0007AEF7A2|nr:uncharacterized protein LOC107607772 [Arachis ipaensis]